MCCSGFKSDPVWMAFNKTTCCHKPVHCSCYVEWHIETGLIPRCPYCRAVDVDVSNVLGALFYYLKKRASEIFRHSPDTMVITSLMSRLGVMIFRPLDDPYVLTLWECVTDQVVEVVESVVCCVCKSSIKRDIEEYTTLLCGNVVVNAKGEKMDHTSVGGRLYGCHAPARVHTQCLLIYLAEYEAKRCFPAPCPLSRKDGNCHAILTKNPSRLMWWLMFRDKTPQLKPLRSYVALVIKMFYRRRIDFLIRNHMRVKNVMDDEKKQKWAYAKFIKSCYHEAEHALDGRRLLLCGPIHFYLPDFNLDHLEEHSAKTTVCIVNERCVCGLNIIAPWWLMSGAENHLLCGECLSKCKCVGSCKCKKLKFDKCMYPPLHAEPIPSKKIFSNLYGDEMTRYLS